MVQVNIKDATLLSEMMHILFCNFQISIQSFILVFHQTSVANQSNKMPFRRVWH